MSNIKIQRTNSDIMKILSVALRERAENASFLDVTILRVETSADYAVARVFVQCDESALRELEKASGFLRNEIASRVKLRQTPQLRFMLDKGRENADRVEELLAQINSKK